MRALLATSLLFISLVSLSQVTTEKVISIGPTLSFQNYEHFKRLTLNSPDCRVEFLSDFNFEWGYDTKVLVKETKLSETLSDGTEYEYELIKVVSKTKVADSTQFNLTIDPQRYYYELEGYEAHMNNTLKQLDDSTYFYFDEVEIEVPEQLRETVKSMAPGKTSSIGRFEFVNTKRIKLLRLIN